MLENTSQLVVTMEAQEWNMLLFILDEVSMAKRVTAPLAAKLIQQLKQQEEKAGDVMPPALRPNGMARDVPN